MRKFPLGVALAFAVVWGCSATISAQTKKSSAPSKAPSTAHSHDLSGVWYADYPRPNSVIERYWVYKFTQDEPPMTPWGQSQFDAAKTSFGPHAFPLKETNDPIYHTCTPPGYPRVLLHPFPFQIIQTPGEIVMLFEYDSIRHQIFTDGRPHDATLGPQWMGDSIGHWEGDTLVTETVNFNDKTWIDRMGHPHTEQLRVVERIRRVDLDHLVDDLTFEDPKAYSKPWSGQLKFVLEPKWTLGEYFCEDQDNFEDIENNETKQLK